MIRRRRTQREIAFSFDSFLDVVANVVGIILRLILVAWVGARSYKANVVAPPPATEVAEDEVVVAPPLPSDPLAAELPKHNAELERVRAKLQDQLQAGTDVEQQTETVAEQLATVRARRRQVDAEAAKSLTSGDKGQAKRAAAATLAEMEERIRKIRDELAKVARAPSSKQTLRYRTPVSQPVQTEELLFECRAGRVTLVDVGSLMDDALRRMRQNSDALRRQWEVQDDTSAVGAFRLHFVVERERSALEEVASAPPDDRSNFRYGISAWQVIPVDSRRGETPEQALAPGSAFRRVIDSVEPQQTAVTFWVYPDSFPAYRKLRDALYDRDMVVAGRPLPEGYPISMSTKHGSVSRGQ